MILLGFDAEMCDFVAVEADIYIYICDLYWFRWELFDFGRFPCGHVGFCWSQCGDA